MIVLLPFTDWTVLLPMNVSRIKVELTCFTTLTDPREFIRKVKVGMNSLVAKPVDRFLAMLASVSSCSVLWQFAVGDATSYVLLRN